MKPLEVAGVPNGGNLQISTKGGNMKNMSFDIQWVLVVVGDHSVWQMKLLDGNIHKRMYNCK